MTRAAKAAADGAESPHGGAVGRCAVHGKVLRYVAYPDEAMVGEWFCEDCEAYE